MTSFACGCSSRLYAELVAFRIGQNDKIIALSLDLRPECGEAIDLVLKCSHGPQVEVLPVLSGLPLRHALEP